MQLARVVGTVVSTSKSAKLQGLKMLLVKPIDIESFEEKGNVVVAFDACGAGELNGGLDLFGLAGHDGVGIDHLKAVVSNSSQPCSGFMWKLRRSSTMRSTYCSVCAVMLMSLRPRFTRIIKLNRF